MCLHTPRLAGRHLILAQAAVSPVFFFLVLGALMWYTCTSEYTHDVSSAGAVSGGRFGGGYGHAPGRSRGPNQQYGAGRVVSDTMDWGRCGGRLYVSTGLSPKPGIKPNP